MNSKLHAALAEPDASLAPAGLDADACYRAMKAHDARFDGSFFTAVTSTGIYCRPVCRVTVPRRENCRFFQLAAQAEAAGFRPCLRCRPELAPRSMRWSTEDASRTLALQAMALIQASRESAASAPEDQAKAFIAGIADRLGISDRHLRRIFAARFGVSPMQVLQTRRLLSAKQLIADTAMPLAQVAQAAGFASVRRFNAAFGKHYGLAPGAMRRAGGQAGISSKAAEAAIEVRLAYRPPYDAAAMMDFIAWHVLAGLETVVGAGADAMVIRSLQLEHNGQHHASWLSAHFDEPRHELVLRIGPSLAPALPRVIERVREMFDLDADPQAIHEALRGYFPHSSGLRVPGSLSGFELAVRAVLGQQITLAAARTMGGRLVAAFGEPINTPHAGITRLFPTPRALLAASSDALGQLGIVRQRQAAIQALASELLVGRLTLDASADVAASLVALKAMPGIGDWTAQYIAMRALRWPDAWPAGDIALQKAIGVRGAKAAAKAAEIWRPWRSYAALRCWHAGPAAAGSPTPAAQALADALATSSIVSSDVFLTAAPTARSRPARRLP